MDIKVNPLTGGISFNLQQKDSDKQAEKREKLAALRQPFPPQKDLNLLYDPQPSRLSVDEKVNLVKSFAKEIIQEEELKTLFQNKQFPICYDGFEPSGRMHIAQGILRAINVNKLVDTGCIFIFWIADLFALLNNKMDGDLDKIRVVGRYFVEIWKAAGMKMHNVKFLWASDEINNHSNEYWLQVIDITRNINITRMKKCSQIMGRAESDELAVSQLLYPAMQANDIFYLHADICSLGLDQRKVNMLAREYAKTKAQLHTPVIVSHYMLSGLKEGSIKMSKSDPDSAIFMEDSESEVVRKINIAYCKPKEVYDEKGDFLNPIMDYCKTIIFPSASKMEIRRTKENGGDITYNSYQELEADYLEGKLHPGDLKPAVSLALNKLIEPVRNHFRTDPVARQLLNQIKLWQDQKLKKDAEQKANKEKEEKVNQAAQSQ